MADVCPHGKLKAVCESCGRPAGELVDEWRDVVVKGHHRPLVLFSLDQDLKIWFHTDGDKKMVRALVNELVKLMGEDTDGS